MSQAGRIAWTLAFQASPILLTRGIAQNVPGGILPIIALTDPTTLLSGGISDPDQFFAQFHVLPGGTIVSQQIAKYTMANQAVAANATIQDGQSVSILMKCPARPQSNALLSGTLGALGGATIGTVLGTGSASGLVAGALQGLGGYVGKLAVITSLAKSISQHNALGGTYSVVTPSYIYTDCVLSVIQDVSPELSTQQQQVQYMWRWDFYQPLVLTQAAATNSLNSIMQKIKQGLPLSGPSQALGAAGLTIGSNAIAPLTSILPRVQGITGNSNFSVPP